MGEKNQTASKTEDPKTEDPKTVDPPNSGGETSKGDSGSEVMTKAEVEALLAKARSEEKAKVYPDLERARKAADEAKAEADAVAKALADAKARLEAFEAKQKEAEEADLDATQRLERRVKELADENAELQNAQKAAREQIEQVATAAEARIRASELAAYRAQKIAAADLILTELVSGSSEEEIDASIETAKRREAIILDKGRDEARKKAAQAVPKPKGPSSDSQPPNVLSVADRRQLANIRDPAEYNSRRAALLKQIGESTN